MGKQKGSSSLEDFQESMKKMKKTELIQYLKGHHFLRPCSQDKPNEWPEQGELVWARSLGSVFWPAFIAKVEDVETNVEGADEVDDSAYRFVMFLETDFRVAPIPWEHIIPLRDHDTQEVMFPLFNKLVVKRSWTPTTCYKKSLRLLRDFLEVAPSERQTKAIDLYNAQTKSKKAPPKKVANEEKAVLVKNEVVVEAEKKRQEGLRVSERIVRKIIVKENESQIKENAITKTESPAEEKVVVKSSKSSALSRPEVGGERLKQWVKEKFEAIDKQFTFDSKPARCHTCKAVLESDKEVKQCHGFPHHVECLVKQDGDGDTPVYKCKTCTEKVCFVCKQLKHGEVLKDEKETQGKEKSKEGALPVKCSRCDLRYHIKCLEDWPQAEIQGQSGPIICPVHFCHTCLGDQRINNQMRDYTVTPSKAFRCSECLSTYHKGCLPAGCGEDVEGKDYIVCPKHKLPQLKVSQRRIGCLSCYKPLKSKQDRVECTLCTQIFHPECVGYIGKTKERYTLQDFGKIYKCASCFWGLFPVYGQVVWFQQSHSQYWPARILYPKEFRNRNQFAKRLLGQFSIEYFGTTSFYDNASRATPLHLTTVDIFKAMKVYQDIPKIQRAHEEAAFGELFAEDFRRELLPKAKPIYKEIKRNVYRTNKSFSIEKNIKTDSHDGMCSCSEDSKSEEVCLPDSGCHNRDTEMECSDKTCGGGKRCTNRMFQRREDDTPFLQLIPMKNKGWGITAKVNFSCGDFVGEYRGEVIDAEEKNRRLERKVEEDPLYILEIDKGLFIDAEYMGSLSRLINHSCEPNCEVRRYASSKGKAVGGVFAVRDIKIGEEVTFNYAYGNESNAPFRCHCGSSKCLIFIGKRVPDGFEIEGDTIDDEVDKWDDVCSICGFGGRVICCEFPGCRKVCHYQCVGLTKPPRSDWCCPEHPEEILKKKRSPNQKSSKAKANTATSKPSNSKLSKQGGKSQKRSQTPPKGKQKIGNNSSDLTTPNPQSMQRSTVGVSVPQPPKRKRKSIPAPNSEPTQKKGKMSTVVADIPKEISDTPTSAGKQPSVLRNSSKNMQTNLIDTKDVKPPSVFLEPAVDSDKRQVSKRKTDSSDVHPIEGRFLFPERITRRRNSVQLPAKIKPTTRSNSSPTDFDGENKSGRRASLQPDVSQLGDNAIISEGSTATQEILQQGSVMTRATIRARSLRSQNQSKGSAPFSPLALNSIPLHGVVPPVFITDTLVPAETDKNSEVTVGIRTRTSPRKATPQSCQINLNSDQTASDMKNGPSSTTADSTLLTFNQIKQEPYDFEEESNIISPMKPRKRTRFFDQNSESLEDTGFGSDFAYADTDTDSDLETIFVGPSVAALRGRFSSSNANSVG
ncbi:Histone-lysine N-methyltransferase, H3 lysine-36 and H4 lysine-20 specific [Orchesella cincta]|uniref:Histone-lysine N-methyltransferase, H3 lysine-36 and H4 lysine-20 specific n=1 Tax=Orchesella cincta TaxID=48709 RepID=A0A1D2MGU5_ORCCI|nr:Histone-lysine N-methyltransferase, H3 lysine-36 and H4 lysine-20 specific [Orchesella cincta]